MENFDCYCCLEKMAVVFSQLPCVDERHKMCSNCYQKLINKKICPICKQQNPNYGQSGFDGESYDEEDNSLLQQSDGDSSEDENNISHWVVYQLNITQMTLIQQRLADLFQNSENQNMGNENEWQ